MGRVLKRVPLNFNWPIGQIWKGYINPIQPIKCSTCGGTGNSSEMQKLHDEWYAFDNSHYVELESGKRYNKNAWQHNLTQDDVDALLKADRLWDFTRVPINDKQKKDVKKKIEDGGNSWLPYDNGYKPTAQEVNEWSRQGMGHDSLNCWIVTKARAKKMGYPLECSVCRGEGHLWQSDKIRQQYKSWENFDPPTGKGYQLWETTSEGSPDSPVFKTLDELCVWCETNATTFASFKTSASRWKKMLTEKFVRHEQGNIIFT